MISLAEVFAQKKIELGDKPEFNSQRAEIFAQLYTYYEKDYKKQCWKEYIAWLKKTRTKHSIISLQQYKKICYPKITIKSFCSYWLAHIPTNDLYYLLSYARDKDNRGESFNKWLFHNLKAV